MKSGVEIKNVRFLMAQTLRASHTMNKGLYPKGLYQGGGCANQDCYVNWDWRDLGT